MRQQSPPWQQQQRSRLSPLEGGSIADALYRLHHSPPAESKPPVQRTAPLERRNGFRDAHSGGNRATASSIRGSPRPFGRSTDNKRSRPSESEAVRVAVRVRPMSEREMAAGLQNVVSVDEGNALSVVDPTAFTAALALESDGQEKVESSMWAKRFSFDRCFGEEDSRSGEGQEKIFDEIGTAVIDQAFSGYNATVFAYGQTGSGKSYTMMGSGAALDESVDPEDHGLIPRICSGIFERVTQMEQEAAASRGRYHGYTSRLFQGYRADEVQEGREMGGAGHSAPPHGDDGTQSCTRDAENFNPTASSSPPKRRSATVGGAAVGESISYADYADAEGAPDTPMHTDFSVEVSYLEIYNESLRDLFNPATPAAAGSHGGKNGGGPSGERGPGVADGGGGGGVSTGNSLRLREDPTSGTYVEGLTSIAVSSWDEMSQLLTYGGSERTVAATNANDWSSRSHAVFTLTLRQTSEVLSPTGSSHETWETSSSVNLVDLAGSERVSHTGATGLRLQEAGSINRSLAALSDVIKALSEAQKRRASGNGGARSPRMHRSPVRGGRGVAATAPKGFVPYRNSVLTRLLKESLGGNSRTVMLACVSPCDAHYEETLGTLRYAERAKRVRTLAVANARRDMSREGAGSDQAALVERLSAQICELKQQLAEATTAKNMTPMSPPGSPMQASGRKGTPGGDAGPPSPGSFAPIQAAGGQGYIYVVDPALQVEIERLKETVADRERVIEEMEMGERQNVQLRKLSTAPLQLQLRSADARDKTRLRQGGGSGAVVESGSSSTRSDASGCFSSPSSPASASVSASASGCSGQLSILTPPRAGGTRGLSEAPAKQSGRNGEAGETSAGTEDGESGMRLLNLNQDPMFSECMSFVIRKDGVTVVGSAGDADVRLAGDDVLPRHAVIHFEPDGNAVLTPLSGASVHINGIPILAGAETVSCRGEGRPPIVSSPGIVHVQDQGHRGGVLRQDCRVLFGSRHFFRVECRGGLPLSPGACSNHNRDVSDGEPSAVEAVPITIDWDFAQRELRGATTLNNDSLNNAESDNTANKIVGGGLVEQERDQDENGDAYAKPEVPERGKEEAPQNPQLPEETSRLYSEGEQEGDASSPDGGQLAASPEIPGSSQRVGADTPSSRGALPGEDYPAIHGSARSEEISQTTPASAPGAPVEVSATSTEASNKDGDCSAPQTQWRSSGVEPPSATPVLQKPRPECDPLLATATAEPMKEDDSSRSNEVADIPPASDCGPSAAMPAGAAVAQNTDTQETTQIIPRSSDKCDLGEPGTEAKLPNASDDGTGILDRSTSTADTTEQDGRRSQNTREAPPPLPPPLPPPSPKAGGGQEEAGPTASSKAVHVNRVTLMELQRVREAWRGAEGELERSQEERDELRATLLAVQEQARDRRRSDRKEKRELDKEKTMAENKARALEADRDRLRQMLSKSDEEVADLRGQLQKAHAVTAAAATTAATTGPNPGECERHSDRTVGLETVSARPPPTTGAAEGVCAAFQRHSSRGRRTGNSSAGNANEAVKGGGSGGWQVQRLSALLVVPNETQGAATPGTEENSGVGEDSVLSDPDSSAEFQRHIDLAETAVDGSEPRKQALAAIPRDPSGLQQQQHSEEQQPMQLPHQQEPRELEQQHQGSLQSEERTSAGTPFGGPFNRETRAPDSVTLVVESGNTTSNDHDANTRSAYASGRSSSTPSARKPAKGTNTNTTNTTTIVITSGEKVLHCYSPTEDQSSSVEEQRGHGSGHSRRRRTSTRGRNLTWEDSAGELPGEGSEEEELAGAGAGSAAGGAAGVAVATHSEDKEQQTPKECSEDDMFLRESRAEIEAARRLLDRHSVTTTTIATAAREDDAVRTNVLTSAAAVREDNSTVVAQPAAGTIRDPGGEASAEKLATTSPALGASPSIGDVANTEGASSNNSSTGEPRLRPLDRSAKPKITGSGGAGAAGDFYRAALSTHLSFIATTAADDPPPSSLGWPDGRVLEERGRKPAGGVGEACRALQGDVAGVRQVGEHGGFA